MKFAPDRWQRDEALRMCGASARGVWMELMCIMHKAEPYGHLLVRGKQPSDKQLSVITGIPSSSFRRRSTSSKSNEVFSRTDDGTIFSRGMVRDAQQHERLSTAGAKGAARRYAKTKGKSGPHSQGDSHPIAYPHGLESEIREREESLPVIPPKLGGPKTELPDDWEPEPFTPGTAAHRIEPRNGTMIGCKARSTASARTIAARSSRYSDWQDTWGGWVRNAEKFDTRDARERQAAAPSSGPKSHADYVLERMRIEKPQPQAEPEEKRAGAN
jgi:hypothetical protein